MAYPEELLAVARQLANSHADLPVQASLRRALSTAYYALFHLLISEAVSACTDPALQQVLARTFDHGPMKQASERKRRDQSNEFQRRRAAGLDFSPDDRLCAVAEIFVEAQRVRHDADYNLLRMWSRDDVNGLLVKVAAAFDHWAAVRETPEARAYLASMLARDRRTV